MLQHAQTLVYSLISLMPSVYQKASLKAVLGLFLDAQGHALPEHTQVKSASSLSRFFNRYHWSTRQVIRTTRAAIVKQLATHPVRRDMPVRLLIDLSTLKKTGKFWHLSTPTDDIDAPEPWVRMLNGKRGLHLVVLYIVIGNRRIPWSFRVWRGKGQPSPNQLAAKLLASVPKSLVNDRTGKCSSRYRIWHRRISGGHPSATMESSCRDEKLSSFTRWPKAQRPSRQC